MLMSLLNRQYLLRKEEDDLIECILVNTHEVQAGWCEDKQSNRQRARISTWRPVELLNLSLVWATCPYCVT